MEVAIRSSVMAHFSPFLASNQQLLGMRLQGIDNELDMLVKIRAQQFHATSDDFSVYLGSERLVFEFLLNAFRFEVCSCLISPSRCLMCASTYVF